MGRKHQMPRVLELMVGVGTPLVYTFMLLVQGKRPFYLAYHFGLGKGLAEWLRTHPGAEHIISMCVGLLCGLVIANQVNNGPPILSKEVNEETRKAIAEAEEKQKAVLDKLANVRSYGLYHFQLSNWPVDAGAALLSPHLRHTRDATLTLAIITTGERAHAYSRRRGRLRSRRSGKRLLRRRRRDGSTSGKSTSTRVKCVQSSSSSWDNARKRSPKCLWR
mmetsp:Transcript_44174/g.120370  ORF Transcript_44174/g.120370 Transcript_44174/m.120370 type:complete len:220 (-) Transcript_44174:535-1194(-)